MMLLAAASTILHPPFQCSIVLNEGPPNPCVISALPPSIRRTFKERKERKEEREEEIKKEEGKESNTLLVYVPINQSRRTYTHL